ncbi:MAG: DUF2442 domain-containing protein [Schwartzia sp.]|nr:DUF2442 domain-containing protein [Schwartzia sp. (in: firmicutes)]MBR1885028.1 DUF2442 domain-containing protein [Schwartzia sp. (in: firmicutes)]
MRIAKVKALPGYKLQLTFLDGRETIYDAAWTTKHLSDYFDQLRDVEYFRQVRADGSGVAWPNGQSIGPEDLEGYGIWQSEENTKAVPEVSKYYRMQV